MNHMGRRQEYDLSNISPDWLACHLGNLSPHWLIGVPIEYDDGCNDGRNTDLLPPWLELRARTFKCVWGPGIDAKE